MGNRAIITIPGNDPQKLAIYLHWNGGRDSIEAFLEYCRIKQYRTPESDPYGWARLAQIISNFFGGATSIGIDTFANLDGSADGDNGTYIIKDWRIIDRIHPPAHEQDHFQMEEMLLGINNAQPLKEQIPRDFFTKSDWVWASQIFPHDIVWVSDCDGHYTQHEILGITEDNHPYLAKNEYGYPDRILYDETFRVLHN